MHIGLHCSCDINFGRSIAMVTDNIHNMGLVKPVWGAQPSSPGNKTAILEKKDQPFSRHAFQVISNRRYQWEFPMSDFTWN